MKISLNHFIHIMCVWYKNQSLWNQDARCNCDVDLGTPCNEITLDTGSDCCTPDSNYRHLQCDMISNVITNDCIEDTQNHSTEKTFAIFEILYKFHAKGTSTCSQHQLTAHIFTVSL
jgi:hypothetical protein